MEAGGEGNGVVDIRYRSLVAVVGFCWRQSRAAAAADACVCAQRYLVIWTD